MNHNKIIKLSIITLITSMLMSCANSTNPSNAPEVSKEGMDLVKSTETTIAYKKDGVDFSVYKNILILPSQVAFKDNWKRSYNNTNSAQRITDKDIAELKTNVASLFDKVFKEELHIGGDKTVVEEPVPSTLLLKPFIINLDLKAPDVNTGARNKTFTREVGEATLYLEVFDATSGEILARVMDSELIGSDSFIQWTNRARNTAEAKRTIMKWAKSLNEQFNKVQTEAK